MGDADAPLGPSDANSPPGEMESQTRRRRSLEGGQGASCCARAKPLIVIFGLRSQAASKSLDGPAAKLDRSVTASGCSPKFAQALVAAAIVPVDSVRDRVRAAILLMVVFGRVER